MTTQPDPVHHLLDRLLRGVLLPEEAEQLAGLVRAREERLALLENGARERSAILEEARDALEAAGINEAHGGESWPRLVPAIEELARRAETADAVAEGNLRHVKQLIPAVRQAEARVRELEADLTALAAASAHAITLVGERAERAEAQVARLTPGTTPAEHCGHQIPALTKHTERTECVLRPGHHGSHANQHGARWWWISNAEATP
ncbi:hypothetical protein [Streptomyces bacillaris]|uniref:hypothetical protein n=1 Tax=Streptomyces bacillaris TaxID=68179 RepID=UPI0036538852